MYTLFAEVVAAPGGGWVRAWGIQEWLILIICIAAAVAVVAVLLKVFGIQLPQWFLHILLIIAAAFVGIAAIRLLFSM